MNQLKMDIQQAISSLSRGGRSQRWIARELGIDRETVARYRQLARQAEGPKPAISPVGSEQPQGANPAIVPAGSEVGLAPSNPPAQPPKPAISPTGSKPGRVSHCGPFEDFIRAGLSAQRIYQDLVSEHNFAGSYDSVKRFVRQLAGAMGDANFRPAMQAILEVLPVGTAFSGVDLPADVVGAGSDFEALEKLRRLAFADQVEPPKQLELWSQTT